LTPAGAKAIAIDESAVPGHVGDQGDSGEDVEQTNPSSRLEHSPSDPSRAAANKNALRHLSAPRGGTKLAQVVELLQQDRGATINELMGATGWLPHTSRAALTGLRKRGFAVALDRSDKERGRSTASKKIQMTGSPPPYRQKRQSRTPSRPRRRRIARRTPKRVEQRDGGATTDGRSRRGPAFAGAAIGHRNFAR
jgi:hypothetical protein